MLNVVFALLLAVQLANGQFSDGFQSFLERQYGVDYAQLLRRPDLGVNGSFGGGASNRYFSLKRDPVILIHGLKTTARDMINIRNFFLERAYKNGSIFATSYGQPNQAIDQFAIMNCSYFLQVRRLIQAVHKYTRRSVVVAGYSLGGPITRKAILGGKCVDTGEDLGKPLTKIVSAYFSVGGVNFGMIACYNPLLTNTPICNNNTGVYPYSSKVIQDINVKKHYEGQKTYVLASLTDEAVGYQEIHLPKADVNVTISGYNHLSSLLQPLHSQYELMKTGRLRQSTLDIDLEAQSELTGINCTGFVTYRHGHGHH